MANEAEPLGGQIVTRKLSDCRFCGDLIYMEPWSDRWKHNKNGTYRCDGTIPSFAERMGLAGPGRGDNDGATDDGRGESAGAS